MRHLLRKSIICCLLIAGYTQAFGTKYAASTDCVLIDTHWLLYHGIHNPSRVNIVGVDNGVTEIREFEGQLKLIRLAEPVKHVSPVGRSYSKLKDSLPNSDGKYQISYSKYPSLYKNDTLIIREAIEEKNLYTLSHNIPIVEQPKHLFGGNHNNHLMHWRNKRHNNNVNKQKSSKPCVLELGKKVINDNMHWFELHSSKTLLYTIDEKGNLQLAGVSQMLDILAQAPSCKHTHKFDDFSNHSLQANLKRIMNCTNAKIKIRYHIKPIFAYNNEINDCILRDAIKAN